jgi:uncharacterized protein
MIRKRLSAVILLVAFATGSAAFAGGPDPLNCAPGSASETKCAPDLGSQAPFTPDPAATSSRSGNLLALTAVPKVVFQINQAADAPTILRFVANYLIAEPAAEVVVVGYGGGVDFMLKGAKDAEGKLYANQLQALTSKGVHFKACNNTLKARKLAADDVAPQVTVVPGAVNEIIRLQTREGYAYFRH